MSKKSKALEGIKTSFEKHVGHTLNFNYGEAAESGKLERVTVDGDCVMLWVSQGGPFLNRFYFDQARKCSCGEGD